MMVDKLSITKGDAEIDLTNNRFDFLAMLIKGLMSIAPGVDLTGIAGFALNISPMLSEVVTSFIPNQKIERVITYLQVLDIKLQHIQEDLREQKLKSAEGLDLLQDSMNQASRAVSDERLEYIASLLKNGLTSDALDHTETKKLFSILNELNDAEIIILKYHSVSSYDEREGFAAKHAEVFTPIDLYKRPFKGPSQQDRDKAAIRDTYETKLYDLGLLKRSYKAPKKGETPEFDDKTGMLKSTGYRITPLADAFLRYLDIAEEEED
jgi:hypothetical protein